MRKGLIIGAILIVGTIGGYAQQFSERIKPLQYRNIGPFRGGRANAGTGVVGDPMTYYTVSYTHLTLPTILRV